jgi:hypothetical protein
VRRVVSLTQNPRAITQKNGCEIGEDSSEPRSTVESKILETEAFHLPPTRDAMGAKNKIPRRLDATIVQMTVGRYGPVN